MRQESIVSASYLSYLMLSTRNVTSLPSSPVKDRSGRRAVVVNSGDHTRQDCHLRRYCLVMVLTFRILYPHFLSAQPAPADRLSLGGSNACLTRTLVFVAATGHFAGAYVPCIRSVVEKHPDLIQKAVGAVTVEHLGCREWLDVRGVYRATGLKELTLVITEFDSTARIMLDAWNGSTDRRSAIVTPTPKGGFNGEGGALSRAGVPTIGYIPIPSYLLAGPENGCIEKLDRQHLHAEIGVLTKAVQQIDAMSRAELRTGGRV